MTTVNTLRRQVRQLKKDLLERPIKPHTRKRAEAILMSLNADLKKANAEIRKGKKHANNAA